MKLLFKFPSRSRPAKLLKCINNILDNCTEQPKILLTLDFNDHLTNTDEVKKELDKLPVIQDWGYSTGKVNAINRNVPETGWDIGVLTSDDIEYTVKGFDQIIINDMKEHFPDLDGALQYPDGFEHGEIWTLPIFGYKYYKRFNYIYHPSYISLFCDEEAIHVGRATGKMYFSKETFYKHMHPAWVKGLQADAQLQFTQKFHPIDQKTFLRRKAQNFFINGR